MGPPKFKDLLKAPTDLLGDDYTTKKTMKLKYSAGGITFNAEDELKLKGSMLSSVVGKVGGKYAHKPSGISIDKLEFKGADTKLELSYPVLGGKTKLKGELKGDKGDTSGSVEFEKAVGGAALLASLSSAYKLDVSLCSGANGLLFGGAVSCLADKMTLKGYDAGASYTSGPLFLGLTSGDKFKAAKCGLTYKMSPVLTLALTGSFPKQEFLGGGAYKVSDALTVKAKVSADALEAVALNKVASGLKVDVGATVPFATPDKFSLGVLVNLG